MKPSTNTFGTEFHQYKRINEHHTVKFYFANPYHSWERGSHENVNGLIRQYLPKIDTMKNLTQQQSDQMADQLNNRPRKRFNYKIPQEIYYGI